MSSIVHIDPAGRREMDSHRDYLDMEQRAASNRRISNVVNFTSRLEKLCTRCGQSGHRASHCPQQA